MQLQGRTAIVTGASLGIGSAIAVALGKEGANVAINYRKHSDEAQKVASLVEEAGGKSLVMQADVASFGDAQSMAAKVVKTFGKIDILVNNAGVNRDRTIWKMSEEEWDTVIDINLKGYFNYVRAVAPLMKEQQSGKIVNVTSINGFRGKFGQSNYSASKAGIIGFTKAVARELGQFNVNVNAVAPGLIETEMMAAAPQQVKDLALSEIVLKRLGRPEEVASVVVFLCTENARHVTGEVINVSGGQYM